MSLVLYHHPLAAYCQKVLIALHEAGTPFEARMVNLTEPGDQTRCLDLWPVGKIPLLYDAARDRTVPESSIIIDYLDLHEPGPHPMLPTEPEARLEARLWDRFFDLHVQEPMQKLVADRLRPENRRDPDGAEDAWRRLVVAYGMIDRQVSGRKWATGDAFGIADCAAAPALFYAGIIAPFPSGLESLCAYFERLLARPSVRRVLVEAQPYLHMFPFRERIPERFRTLSLA